MATLNVKQLQQNIANSVINVLKAQKQAINEGMFELEADLKDRIFLDGKDSEGSAIGNYSTKPIYVSVSGTSQVRSSSLKPRGKNSQKGQRNQGTFKNGKERKSMYLPGGYSEYRKVVGRQNKTVDLNLTGSLLKDIRVDPSEGISRLVFTTDEKVKIAAGNETRFGKTIFDPTSQEIENLIEKWQTETTAAFYKSFDDK